jgi:hypothetical protein
VAPHSHGRRVPLEVQVERLEYVVRVLKGAIREEVALYAGTGVEVPYELEKALAVEAELRQPRRRTVLNPQNREKPANSAALSAVAGLE